MFRYSERLSDAENSLALLERLTAKYRRNYCIGKSQVVDCVEEVQDA
ncbi:MAG: hypothetical protein JXM73_08265 [Anaerolineae bacterium]|nr:hypothetical protein [Anaerolineae bacterium]